jgi:tetratricopeptide (TPR) repeat protein
MKKVLFLSLLLAGFVCMGCQNNGNPENDVNNNNVVEEIEIEEIGTDEDNNDNNNNDGYNEEKEKEEMVNDLFNEGNKALEAGNVNEAISNFNKALEIKDDADWIYGDLGRAQAENKDFDGAIESYTKAIDLNSGRSVYFSWRADAYRSKGQTDLAEQDQKTADDLHSKGMD